MVWLALVLETQRKRLPVRRMSNELRALVLALTL